MIPAERHLLINTANIRRALESLNVLAADAILFIVDEERRLIGSLTDGDLRRGLLNGFSLEDPVTSIIQPSPKFLKKGNYSLEEVIGYRQQHFRILPVLDADGVVINVVNFRHHVSCIPADVVLMAGGRGERLRPMTDEIPKPLLVVGDKPIIEHNIDRLARYGFDDLWISLRYKGSMISDYFGTGVKNNIPIRYITEEDPLGTIGSLSLIPSFSYEHVLVMNSDILSNINFEDFFLTHIREEADISVACIPYQVAIPYAVIETSNNVMTSLREKPLYTYFSNAGIYLIRKSVIERRLSRPVHYNATDLMEDVVKDGGKVYTYPMVDYWLDIGNPDDFAKAKEDIKHIRL